MFGFLETKISQKLKITSLVRVVTFRKQWKRNITKTPAKKRYEFVEFDSDYSYICSQNVSTNSSETAHREVILFTPELPNSDTISKRAPNHVSTRVVKMPSADEEGPTMRQKAIMLLMSALSLGLLSCFLFPESRLAKIFTAVSLYALVVVYMF